MKLLKSLMLICASITFSSTVSAAPITINFDTSQASYIPNSPAVQQNINNQFASLGIIFQNSDGSSPSVGDCTSGVGSDPFHLYGQTPTAGSFGCGDTTPNINFIFVDPSNSSNQGFTTSFSLLVTDGLGTTMTAFDRMDNVIGTTFTTSGFNERIGLSGIGQISRINVNTPLDATAYDNLMFESVSAINAVPEPSSIALLGLGLLGLAAGRRRK